MKLKSHTVKNNNYKHEQHQKYSIHLKQLVYYNDGHKRHFHIIDNDVFVFVLIIARKRKLLNNLALYIHLLNNLESIVLWVNHDHFTLPGYRKSKGLKMQVKQNWQTYSGFTSSRNNILRQCWGQYKRSQIEHFLEVALLIAVVHKAKLQVVSFTSTRAINKNDNRKTYIEYSGYFLESTYREVRK